MKITFKNNFDDAGIVVLFSSFVVIIGVIVGTIVGYLLYDSLGNKALLKAYNECLSTLSRHPIDEIHLFCDKIQDKL